MNSVLVCLHHKSACRMTDFLSSIGMASVLPPNKNVLIIEYFPGIIQRKIYYLHFGTYKQIFH